MKTEEEKLRPTFHNLMIRMIDHTFWPEIEKNRKKLKEAGLWDFLLIPLEHQDDARTRQFLHKSVWGSKSKVNMDGRIIHFTLANISKIFKLPQKVIFIKMRQNHNFETWRIEGECFQESLIIPLNSTSSHSHLCQR